MTEKTLKKVGTEKPPQAQYDIHDIVEVPVNGRVRRGTIIGFEQLGTIGYYVIYMEDGTTQRYKM